MSAPRRTSSRAGLRQPRGQRALATLEWLIVVSVSALLAALVLAYVQRNVERSVSDVSAATVSGRPSLARAQALAVELAHRVQLESLDYDPYDYRFTDPRFWSNHFSTRCRRIVEVFSDLEAEGVRVEIEADFRVSVDAEVRQELRPTDFGEIPWTYGPISRIDTPRRQVPAFTVCQVFLSYEDDDRVSS